MNFCWALTPAAALAGLRRSPQPLGPSLNYAQAREALGPWLAQHFSPENCNAYGYLRQENPAEFGYAAQIAFNYLGRLTGQPDEEASLMLSALAPGLIPELGPRRHGGGCSAGAFGFF